MFSYKSIVAAVAVASMVVSSAYAADSALAPGKPAGVEKAQLGIGTGTLILGAATIAVVAAVAITVSDQSGNNQTAGTFATATTSTTP
ncbi:MAG TPA: hypothetical protein VGC16_00230 [Rhizomicrobium sp.]